MNLNVLSLVMVSTSKSIMPLPSRRRRLRPASSSRHVTGQLEVGCFTCGSR